MKRMEVTKLPLHELKETFNRISDLLKKPAILNKLGDKGAHIKKLKEKIEKEIKFREDMEETSKQMQSLSLQGAKVPQDDAYALRLCEMEKEPETERFKPFSSLKSPRSNKIEFSVKETTKRIQLPESLDLQKNQEERVKTEQVRVRQERLTHLNNIDDGNTETDNESEDLSTKESDAESEAADDEPHNEP